MGALRWIFAGVALAAGIGPWWMAREEGGRAFPGFVVEEETAVAATGVVFKTGRINAGSAQAKAHSATLAEMPDGSLVAAWYAGSGEGAADVSIYLARREIGG